MYRYSHWLLVFIPPEYISSKTLKAKIFVRYLHTKFSGTQPRGEDWCYSVDYIFSCRVLLSTSCLCLFSGPFWLCVGVLPHSFSVCSFSLSVPWSRFAPCLPDVLSAFTSSTFPFFLFFILRFASACFFYLYYLPVLFSGITAGCLFFYLPAFGSFFFDAHNINLILRSEWYKTVLVTGFKHESSLKKLQFLALQLRLSALIWHLTSRPFKWNRRPTRRGDPRLSSGELTAVISPMFLHLNWAVTILSFTAASWLVRALSDRLPARLVASARHLTHFSFFIPTSAAVCLRRALARFHYLLRGDVTQSVTTALHESIVRRRSSSCSIS